VIDILLSTLIFTSILTHYVHGKRLKSIETHLSEMLKAQKNGNKIEDELFGRLKRAIS
jgi:hypothetical protein